MKWGFSGCRGTSQDGDLRISKPPATRPPLRLGKCFIYQAFPRQGLQSRERIKRTEAGLGTTKSTTLLTGTGTPDSRFVPAATHDVASVSV
jgi:hypothetical protein